MSNFEIRRFQLRTSLKKALRVFLFIFAPLALPLQSLAQKPNTDLIDLSLWGDMYQVMAGNSTETPLAVTGPIRTPQGIYAYVQLDQLITPSINAGINQDTAFQHYFTFLLDQPEVAGIQFSASWSELNNVDPSTIPKSDVPNAYYFQPLDDAFIAINKWNIDHQGKPPKTLQLTVTAGFKSPGYLFKEIDKAAGGPGKGSCDALFQSSSPAIPSCGYTTQFTDKNATPPANFPLPWNETYKQTWQAFVSYLWNHIKKNGWEQLVVSVSVGGPTSTSNEIILPNSDVMGDQPQNVLSIWNCLLANNYGVNSPYLNSNRAFIEEWAAAIDMFGSIFSGVTLIVTTGNGLPNFTTGSEMSLPCPGLAGITLPSSATPGYQKLLLPHPAFEPDCGNTPHATPARPLFPMDCAAEVAILAYFAQPSVGGANAKATNEAALSASDNNVPTLYSLSNASVKWLSKNTDDLVLFGPQPDPTAPLSTYPEGPIGIPLVSRMMGGLQFTLPAAVLPPQPGHAITGSQAVGCPTWTQSPCGDLIPEQALFNALRVFFGGTSKASAFDAPATIMNNEAPVTDAPMNFLQIWADDIQYAAGAGACTIAEIMKETCVRVSQNKMPAIFIRFFGGDHGRTATAQDILVFASKNIPTTPVTNADLYWYNKCKNKNQIPYCEKGSYYHRDAFEEDLPCVSASQQNAAIQETNNGLSKNPKLNNYSTNTTDYSVHPYYYQPVPYGRCAANYVWRQSYMGDYVCVTQQDQAQILDQNAGIVSGVGITCP